MKQEPRPVITDDEFEQWREDNPEPAPDLALLRKALAAIDAEPEQWDQGEWDLFKQDQTGEWSCGTARCVAGWAATLAPALVAADYEGDVDVANTGQHALGLTSNEAFNLFKATLYPGLVVDPGRLAGRAEQRANIQTVAERIAARAGGIL